MKRDMAIRLSAAAALMPLLSARAAAADAIRVIGLPIDTGLEVQYAQAAGLVEQSGLNLHVDTLAFGAAVQAAVVGGAAEIGLTNVSSLATARERGLPLVVIAPSGLYISKEPSSVLMVARDSALRNASDLNGKTVAVNGLKSISQLGPEAWIDKNGGDSKTVHWIDMPFADMPLALSAHRIDAALVAEPQATTAKKDARVFANVYDAIAPRFLITAWFANAAWVTANPEPARKFATMIYRAAAWSNAHRAQTAEVLIASTHLDPEIVHAMPRVTFAESAEPATMKPHLDAALRYGLITKPASAEAMFAPELRKA